MFTFYTIYSIFIFASSHISGTKIFTQLITGQVKKHFEYAFTTFSYSVYFQWNIGGLRAAFRHLYILLVTATMSII